MALSVIFYAFYIVAILLNGIFYRGYLAFYFQFGFFESVFRVLDKPVLRFNFIHQFKNLVFDNAFVGFCFLDFKQQCLISVIGFYGIELKRMLAYSLFPGVEKRFFLFF